MRAINYAQCSRVEDFGKHESFNEELKYGEIVLVIQRRTVSIAQDGFAQFWRSHIAKF